MSGVLVLFDDDVAQGWLPLTLTRPAGELRYGALTLRERTERVLGLRCIGHRAVPHLATYDEPWAPPVLAEDDVPNDAAVVFLSSRVVPGWQTAPDLGTEPQLLAVEGMICGWFAPASAEHPDDSFLHDPDGAAPAGLPVLEIDGAWLRRPWDLISGSPEQVAVDAGAAFPGPRRTSRPVGVHLVGGHTLIRGEGVRFEPGVVLDVTRGPIWLEGDVTIRAFTRLVGPSHVAAGSTLLGGSMEAVTIGPHCKMRGELEETIVLGYANKAHDGFLGHSLVGMWVNLGALTTNSDLKNNYGSVRMWTPDGVVDTGELKLGCLIGDHVKTAIGTMIGTGTVIGAGANVFGDRWPPTRVPPFAWGASGGDVHELDRFLATAELAMGRRDVALSERQRTMLRAAWQHARSP